MEGKLTNMGKKGNRRKNQSQMTNMKKREKIHHQQNYGLQYVLNH